MLLENGKIRLRAVEPEDLDRLYIWENNAQLWIAGNTRNPYSKFLLKQYISESEKDIYDSKQLRLMMECKNSGKTVGTVDLFDFDIHNSRIALGLFVEDAFQGKGYAKASLQLVEQYIFDFLKINQLYAKIAVNNLASIHMFEKENFEKNGILKDWIKTIDGFESIVVFQQFRANYLSKKQL